MPIFPRPLSTGQYLIDAYLSEDKDSDEANRRFLTLTQIETSPGRVTAQLQTWSHDAEVAGAKWIYEPESFNQDFPYGLVSRGPRTSAGQNQWLVIRQRDPQQRWALKWLALDANGKYLNEFSQPSLFKTLDDWSLESATENLPNQACALLGSQHELKSYLEIQCIFPNGMNGIRFSYALQPDEQLTGFKDAFGASTVSGSITGFYVGTSQRVLAFNTAGRLMWASLTPATGLRVVGSRLFLTHPRTGSAALDLRTGARVASAPKLLGAYVDASPDQKSIAIGHTVMKSDDGDTWDMRLTLVRARDLSTVWEKNLDLGAEDFLNAMRFDSSSRVWITGLSAEYVQGHWGGRNREEHTLTVAYSLEGQELFRDLRKNASQPTLLEPQGSFMVLLTMMGFGQVYR